MTVEELLEHVDRYRWGNFVVEKAAGYRAWYLKNQYGEIYERTLKSFVPYHTATEGSLFFSLEEACRVAAAADKTPMGKTSRGDNGPQLRSASRAR